MTEVQPLRNLVYIERLKREVSAGGIHLAQTWDHRNNPRLKYAGIKDYFEAKVLSVGPQVREVNPGDTVLVYTFTEDNTKLWTGEKADGDRLFVAYPDDLLAVVEDA